MNDKYVALYHQGVSSYALHKVVLDRNFQVISDEEINSYKTNKYYLALDEPTRLSDNSYLIWGRYNGNTGAALLKAE